MPFAGEWCKVWIYFGFVFAWTKGARPRFDTSTDMGLVLVPADAEVDSVIFRLRATDQDADFPLVFEITATITPVVRIDNLPCTLYNKVCQANVILTKRLVPGRLHDFAVRVRDTKGDSNSMQATISVTNATTPRDKIFPHIPSLIMVPEDTKPGKELDYLLVRANSWSGKPVYIELWQPKELFTIRQRQTPTQTRGVVTLIGELDFETQSMYTLTMYATDPYTEPGKDTRNIAGLSVVVIVQDVQDVPPIFTLAPPLTRINNSVQPGDTIVRVHAEDGDKGVPREIVYGLVSESNPFTPFFNISEASGEITLARPLEELTQITHVGAPVVLTVVAEEIRRSREEPPAQATVVDVGFLLGEPGNSPPYFESDNYMATIDENLEPGTVISFGEQYSTKVKDEDIGKAGVFALKLENNNGTFEISPTVAERTANFVISVRDNAVIDYELNKVLSFKIVAQEVGPATNLSASVPVTIFLGDINDNPPVFEEESYEVTLSENVTEGSRVIQVHATDKDTGVFSSVRYTSIIGDGSEAFTIDPDTGLITVAMGTSLDRELAARLVLSVEARDENGSGNIGVVPLIVNLLDVNDNAPVFEKDTYEFMLNADLTNFTSPAFIKAIDADAETPNNVVRYELIHGNYENKFYLNETSGELILRSPITKIRRKKQSVYDKSLKTAEKEFVKDHEKVPRKEIDATTNIDKSELLTKIQNKMNSMNSTGEIISEVIKRRRKRAEEDALYTLTARAYDLGVPHLSSATKIRIVSGIAMEARIMMFVVPSEQPDSKKTAETLAAITGGRVTVLETRPYVSQNHTGSTGALPAGGKKSIIVARVEQTEPGTPLVDVEKIREALAANGVGIIGGTDGIMNTTHVNNTKDSANGTPHSNVNDGQTTIINNTITNVQSEEVTVYKAENKLLFWLLIILGLLMLVAIAALIICCICPGCPFYMAPRKRRVHSSETLVVRADGRPKRHLHRQPAAPGEVSWNGRKQAWSADPTRRNWQFNKRNVKNCSLPGDVAYISGQPNDVHAHPNVDAHRLRNGLSYGHSRRSRMNEQERMYMEDVEGQKMRGYDTAEMDSLHQHEVERGSDLQRQAYMQRSGTRYMEPEMPEETTVREQHFYREGNAEVLRLVTRGQMEDTTNIHHSHHHGPTTLMVDGKDIILQRFIEDQNSRHELPMHDIEAPRSMESHQRTKELFQQQQPEIILVPDRLELGHRQHIEEIGPNVQRLVIDHGDYESQKMEKEAQIRESLRQEKQETVAAGTSVPERLPMATKENIQTNNTQYSFHDLELARQNALLTRLLLEKENRRGGAAAGVDSTSYLETQSLPGQVAIATQTDRTAATQTDRHVRSRSDNDESDEESRHKKKLKCRKKYGDGDWKRTRTLWMKSPIEEEGGPCFDKRLSILRKKVKEVKEGRKISLEPEVLREISDSLDGNGSSGKGEDDNTKRRYKKSTEQTGINYKVLNEKENGSLSSEEMQKGKRQKGSEDGTDDQKMNVTESTSSSEIKVQREKRGRERVVEKSPKKEAKSKTQKKSGGVIKPSFKILEKEFTMLTRKLGKLGDKKFHESTGSDSTSQDKSESMSKELKKDSDQRSSKKEGTSSSQKQTVQSVTSVSKSEQKLKQKKDSAIAKTKQKLKYQEAQMMSTGSSEYDDTLDKPKKSGPARHETVKPTQSVSNQSHLKQKRMSQADRRELRRQVSEFRDEDSDKRKDGPVKELAKAELKPEKVDKGKVTTRATKLAAISRRNLSEETSTSTGERKSEKGTSSFADFEKKSSLDLSERDSNSFQQDRQTKTVVKKVIDRFSDDFVENSKMESTQEKTPTSTEEEQIVDAKIVTKQDLDTTGKVTLGTGGLEKFEGTTETIKKESVEERMGMEKLSHGFVTSLDSEQELNKAPIKEEQLTEGRGIIRDQTIDNVMLPEVEIAKVKEPKQHEEADIKSIHGETIKQNDKGEKEEYELKDKSGSETKSGTVKPAQENLENYPESDKSSDDSKREIKSKSEDELQDEKQMSEEQGDLSRHSEQKAEEILTDVEKRDDPIAKLEQMDVNHKMEKISTENEKEDSPVDININEKIRHDIQDKSDIKQETKNELEYEILARETSNGKVGLVQKIEEPVQECVKSEIQSDSQHNIAQKEIHLTDKKEGKPMEDTTVPYVDDSTKEEKEDVIKVTSNDQKERTSDLDKMEVPREDSIDVRITEENVFLDDRKRADGTYELQDEDRKSKTVDEIAGSTVLDNDQQLGDKEETTAKKATEAQEINKETTKGPNIVDEPTGDHKAVEKPAEAYRTIGESTEGYKIVEQSDESNQIVEKQTEVYKEDENPTEHDKIVGEPTESFNIAEEQSEVCKTDGGLTVSQNVVGEPIVSHKIVEEPAEAYKSIEESTEVDKLVGEPTASHKIVDAPTNGHKVDEEITEDSKISEETTENYNVTEKVPTYHKDAADTTTFRKKEKVEEEEKETLTNIDDDRISDKENVILDEEKDSSEGVASIAEKKVDEQTISLYTEETVNITNADVNEKKSAPLDKPEVTPKRETTAGQAVTDQYKIPEKEHISFGKSSKVSSDENTQGVDIGSNIVDEHVIKAENDAAEEKTKETVTEAQEIDSEINKRETVLKREESADGKVSENENFRETQNLGEGLTSDKDTIPEISKTEEHALSEISKTDEKEEKIVTIQDHYDKENFPLDTQICISEKQETEEPKATLETTISTSGNTDKEAVEPSTDDTSKKERVLSDVFKVVHSLVGKFKNDKKSALVPSKTETEKIKHPVDTKIVKEEVPSLFNEDKDKNTNKMELLHSGESSSLQVIDEASKFAEEKTRDTARDKTTSPTDDKPTSDPKDNIEKKSPINDILDKKDTEESIEINRTSKEATETPVSKKSIEEEDSNKSSTEESVSPTKEISENLKDREDVAEEILKATPHEDEKSEKVLDNETIDGKLSRTTEKQEQLPEPPSKGTSSSQRSELLETSPQTSDTTDKEKFALDSITSETPADSTKILGPEKRLMPGNERTELQEVEQFVGEETFTPEGNKVRPLPEEQSHMESDASVTASREESIKQDSTKESIDETVPLTEDLSKENKNDEPIEEEYSDVSLPLFSSVIVDDSDDSDSSSDISRKTTLTTRPYQTPRHHAREFPEKEGGQAMDNNDSQSIDDEEEETLTLELFDDKQTGLSKTDKQSENSEDITYAPVEETLPTKVMEEVDKEAVLSETDSKNIQIPLAKEKPATDTESTKKQKQVESKYVSRIDGNPPTPAARLRGRKLGPEAKHQDRTISKNPPLSVSRVAKAETSKVADRRMKEWEKIRVPSQRKKHSTFEEPSEEKVARSQGAGSQARYRTRKKTAEEQLTEKDSEQTRQSRRIGEESRRKQSQAKLKGDKDKKSSSSSETHQTPPKTGEIDTSKAQPKYMAWYKKNREEMERKRAELMATDDEEQLPRWLRRSMRNQKAEKEEKQASSQKTVDTTPRVKRKVKPLVNVESEQLKAIVRQGRKLRKAEGGKNEDPPVQIFATTPPAISQTDLKHYLVQHSEYKYEKIPAPFYLHPPPAPHPSPQLSPEHFDTQPSMERGRADEDFDSSIAVSLQGGNRLRHQQLLEKKSVFDIAYSEAAPSQLRSDSTTPPS